MRRTIFDDEHEMFRETAQAFVEREIVPNHEKWEADGKVDKAMFRKAGDVGLPSTSGTAAAGFSTSATTPSSTRKSMPRARPVRGSA